MRLASRRDARPLTPRVRLAQGTEQGRAEQHGDLGQKPGAHQRAAAVATMTPCCSAVLQNWRLMVSTASATTTTPAARPCRAASSQKACPQADPDRRRPPATAGRREGKADPEAARAPPMPARWRPMAKPGWLEAGPGSSWLGQQLGELRLVQPASRWTKVLK